MGSVITQNSNKSPDGHCKAISGKIILVGFEPDGDSIRFRADNIDDFKTIYRSYKLNPSRDGSVQLRLDGIDAQEIHYGGGHLQPREEISRNVLLNYVFEFADLQFNKLKVIRSSPAQMDATIAFPYPTLQRRYLTESTYESGQ